MKELIQMISVLLVANASIASAGEAKKETDSERDARMRWWKEARFGMFIH